MTCDFCESEMQESDEGYRLEDRGDYEHPPEYERDWTEWWCPVCGDFKLTYP